MPEWSRRMTNCILRCSRSAFTQPETVTVWSTCARRSATSTRLVVWIIAALQGRRHDPLEAWARRVLMVPPRLCHRRTAAASFSPMTGQTGGALGPRAFPPRAREGLHHGCESAFTAAGGSLCSRDPWLLVSVYALRKEYGHGKALATESRCLRTTWPHGTHCRGQLGTPALSAARFTVGACCPQRGEFAAAVRMTSEIRAQAASGSSCSQTRMTVHPASRSR